jgi:superfamily I DNA/RNA helicase
MPGTPRICWICFARRADAHGVSGVFQGRARSSTSTRARSTPKPLSAVISASFPWCEEHVAAIAELFKAYGARKRALGVLDLDDLLLNWRALVIDDVVGPVIADAFDHLLIDEYQDVNGLQVEIVRALRRHRREVTAVGDDFQAIYGWRAASAEHILQFPRHFPDATVGTLERNYRSTQSVLDVANALATQDKHAFPKRLRTEHPRGSRPAASHATRAHSVVVFPVPAPARTSNGPSAWVAAARCSTFSCSIQGAPDRVASGGYRNMCS